MRRLTFVLLGMTSVASAAVIWHLSSVRSMADEVYTEAAYCKQDSSLGGCPSSGFCGTNDYYCDTVRYKGTCKFVTTSDCKSGMTINCGPKYSCATAKPVNPPEDCVSGGMCVTYPY